MEKREDYLRQAKEILEAGGVSVDDFVRYCAEKETTSAKKKMVRAKVSAQNFAFEVMYEGMVRSWVPLEGKKPLGVIFENHLITLRDSPRTIPWEKAMEYCRKIKVEGHACSAGKIEFWEKVVNLSEEKKKILDDLLISLGGGKIAVQGKWRWSSSEYNVNSARVFCTLKGVNWGGVSYVNKYRYNGGYIVRPVLDLSELS